MKQITHLERALQIIHSKKSHAAAAIVPLALAAPVLGDTVQFSLNTPSLTARFSGGLFGTIGNAFLPGGSGVRLWGDTKPADLFFNWVTADDALANPVSDDLPNVTNIVFSWGGGLTGQVLAGDIFNVMHDFEINLGGLNPGSVSWVLDAEVLAGAELLTYSLSSSDPSLGDFQGSVPQAFVTGGTDGSWMASLSILWTVSTEGNPFDNTLQLSIPQNGSIDLNISAVPLPGAVWMGGAILGVLAWARRKGAKPV